MQRNKISHLQVSQKAFIPSCCPTEHAKFRMKQRCKKCKMIKSSNRKKPVQQPTVLLQKAYQKQKQEGLQQRVKVERVRQPLIVCEYFSSTVHSIQIYIRCQCIVRCGAMHWSEERIASPNVERIAGRSEERIASRSAQSPQVSKCSQKGKQSLPLLSVPALVLQQLLSDSATCDRQFRQNIRLYNSALSMATATPNWVNRGSVTSFSNSTITLQRHIYHYIEALMPSAQLISAIKSVHIFDGFYSGQAEHRTRGV